MQACKDQSLSDLNDWRSWAYVNNKKLQKNNYNFTGILSYFNSKLQGQNNVKKDEVCLHGWTDQHYMLSHALKNDLKVILPFHENLKGIVHLKLKCT